MVLILEGRLEGGLGVGVYVFRAPMQNRIPQNRQSIGRLVYGEVE